MEDMTWSYSRVASFDSCPYAWFLGYIKHVEEEPQFYSSYGSFVHKLLEQYYNGELTKDQLAPTFLFGFKQEVKGDRPSEAIVEKYIKRGLEYFDKFVPFPYNMVAVEKEVKFEIDGLSFIGYIDFLGEKDGEFVIIDHKSRDLKPRSKRSKPTENDKLIDKMLRQLYLYSTSVKNEYGKFPVKLCFNCYKAGTFIEEPFNMDAYNEAVEWAKRHIELIKDTEKFPPNIDFFNCKYLCGYGKECCYWENGKYLWKHKK